MPSTPVPIVKLDHIESVVIDTTPGPDRIRYEIKNIGGKYGYLLLLEHVGSTTFYGCRPTQSSGEIEVPGLARKRGPWRSYLLVDDEVVHRTEFELDLTLEWLAESIGRVEIRFGDTDGMLDRIGATVVSPWPKDDTQIKGSRDDLAICILFQDLPDATPPSAKFVLQILRPGDKGLYYRDEGALAPYVGYRLKVKDYLPGCEPGIWHFMVTMGSKILASAELKIQGKASTASLTDNPVDPFSIHIIG